jgi:transcriptional regulator with XRE-family HTH domain
MSASRSARPQPARGMLHERRISQRAVARRGGCSPQFLSQVLLGQAKPPKALQALLAELLQVEVSALFDEELLTPSPAHPGDHQLEAPAAGGQP